MTTDKPRKRKFTDEFKADAVQLVEQSGRTVAQVARELEINESTLLGWVKAAHPNRGCRSWGLKPPDSRRHLAM